MIKSTKGLTLILSTLISFGVGSESVANSISDSSFMGEAHGKLYKTNGKQELLFALQPELIPQIVNGFAPDKQHWELQMEKLYTDGTTTHFRFVIHNIDDSELNVHMDNVEVPQDSYLLWNLGSYVSRLTNSLVSAAKGAAQLAAYLPLAKVAGDVTHEEFECPEPYERVGHRLHVDLKDSAYSVLSLATKLSVNFCFQTVQSPSDREYVHIRSQMEVEPGSLLRVEGKDVLPVLDQEAMAWLQALVDTVLLRGSEDGNKAVWVPFN